MYQDIVVAVRGVLLFFFLFTPEVLPLAFLDGGSDDPETNAVLAAVLKRVKSQGIPKDNIENALKKVCSELRI